MTIYRLWEGRAPFALGDADSDIPTLTDYGVAGEAAAGCVICPGGAYAGLADHEGHPVALWLESIGVRSFVLKYRLGPRYHHPVEMGDAERAMRYVRFHAKELGVDPSRMGILGFSAGGHLASTVCTHGGGGDTLGSDPVQAEASLPDWSVLVYPVISMIDPYAHEFSREMLLGKYPSEALERDLSSQLTVSLSTPPCFLFQGADDATVPVQNSLLYAEALASHHVPFTLHVPPHGPHGFGLGQPGSDQDWTGLCRHWLQERKIAP